MNNSTEAEWQVGVVFDNALIFADMVGLSSITLVEEFTEPAEGTHAVKFTVGAVEFQMLAPTVDPRIERDALLKEIELQATVIDKQLDVLDPEGAGFLVKSRNWYRRKKKKADAVDPVATLLCGDRLMNRLQLMKRVKELNAIIAAETT